MQSQLVGEPTPLGKIAAADADDFLLDMGSDGRLTSSYLSGRVPGVQMYRATCVTML